VKLYLTGFNSFFSNVLRKNIKDMSFYQIKSLTNSGSSSMNFELNLKSFKDPDSYIVHSAWNMKERNLEKSYSINVLGSKLFFDSLEQDLQKRFIFISSTSAFNKSESVYGMHKFEVETYVLEKGGIVIKCGLVVDEQDPFSGGFFSELYNLAKKTPVIPNFTGNQKVYEITKSSDLQKAFTSIGSTNLINAYQDSITFRELVNKIMKIEKKIIDLPIFIGIYSSKFFNFFKFPLGLNFDSLLSLRSRLKRLRLKI